jgi:pSer/pThr/pTyr-binding forkhead associated (FHA) protein
MKVQLLVKIGKQPRRRLTLRGSEAIIGRSRGNTVCIPSDDVSRKHCRLTISGNQVFIEDLQSTNGTYLNEELIEGIHEVLPRDQIRLGPVEFVIEFDPHEIIEAELEAPEKPEPQPKKAIEATDPALQTISDNIRILQEPDPVPVQPPSGPKGGKKPPPRRVKPPAEPAKPEFDLSWHTAGPGKLNEILQGLEEGEVVEEDED